MRLVLMASLALAFSVGAANAGPRDCQRDSFFAFLTDGCDRQTEERDRDRAPMDRLGLPDGSAGEDDDRGHGNDPDGHDDDNPGQGGPHS